MRIAITGGAGFIGSALIRYLLKNTKHAILNIDKLTYAGNLKSLDVSDNANYSFAKIDICDKESISKTIYDFKPDSIIHLAAESHVDRSIDAPKSFIQTNIVGTYNLLECSYRYWKNLPLKKKQGFRFQHISTDEVYGSLENDGFFTETTPYMPRSPYSASKAASDHLVMAWHHTYLLPVVVTNCSNNYGPFQFPEKLIPLVTLNALEGKQLPIYGKGDNIRDWLYVEDHANALISVLEHGKCGTSYNIGGNNEKTNLQVVETICDILDRLKPRADRKSYREQIVFVPDRPGHDKRYAIDASKIKRELNWQPKETFESGMRKTIKWYLNNQWWWQPIREKQYNGQRLGNR